MLSFAIKACKVGFGTSLRALELNDNSTDSRIWYRDQDLLLDGKLNRIF